MQWFTQHRFDMWDCLHNGSFFKVAPAELEDLLRSYPGVMDVAVVGVPCDKAGEAPRAYVVRDPSCGQSLTLASGTCRQGFFLWSVSNIGLSD